MMTALYGKKGQAVAFLADEGRVISLKGRSLAWVSGENIYNYTGDHIGWWADEHLRGPDGGVLAWHKGSTNLGVTPPDPATTPNPPIVSTEPERPTPNTPPFKPTNKWGWSDYTF